MGRAKENAHGMATDPRTGSCRKLSSPPVLLRQVDKQVLEPGGCIHRKGVSDRNSAVKGHRLHSVWPESRTGDVTRRAQCKMKKRKRPLVQKLIRIPR